MNLPWALGATCTLLPDVCASQHRTPPSQLDETKILAVGLQLRLLIPSFPACGTLQSLGAIGVTAGAAGAPNADIRQRRENLIRMRSLLERENNISLWVDLSAVFGLWLLDSHYQFSLQRLGLGFCGFYQNRYTYIRHHSFIDHDVSCLLLPTTDKTNNINNKLNCNESNLLERISRGPAIWLNPFFYFSQ